MNDRARKPGSSTAKHHYPPPAVPSLRATRTVFGFPQAPDDLKRCVGFSGTGRHDQQQAFLAFGDGFDHTVNRFKQDWLHPITPVKNLYLTGADIVTAGVGGALMGGVMTTCCMVGWKSYQVMDLIKNIYKPEVESQPLAVKS